MDCEWPPQTSRPPYRLGQDWNRTPLAGAPPNQHGRPVCSHAEAFPLMPLQLLFAGHRSEVPTPTRGGLDTECALREAVNPRPDSGADSGSFNTPCVGRGSPHRCFPTSVGACSSWVPKSSPDSRSLPRRHRCPLQGGGLSTFTSAALASGTTIPMKRQRGETDSGDSAELMVAGWRAREACSCLGVASLVPPPPDPPCEGPESHPEGRHTQLLYKPPLFGALGVQHQQCCGFGAVGIIRRHRLANGKQVHFGILVELFALCGHHAFQR